MRNVDAGQKRDFLTRLVLGSDMYSDTKYGAAREGHVLCNCAAGMLRDVLYAWIVGLRHEFVAILEKWKSKRFLASRDESRKYSVCTLAVSPTS